MIKRVLIGCEFSSVVREAFTARGFDAWSCDLLPSDTPGNHYEGSVLDILDAGWDMAIFFPPCTYLCNSGVRWIHTEPGRWIKMIEGAMFFKKLLTCNIPKIAIENPIQHKYAKMIIDRPHDQIIQPWQFGHGETKATCLWLKNLPKLIPTNIVEGREQRIWKLPKTADRGKLRSKTFPGIAEGMAEQWGELLREKLIA